jgi:hypothetical protein
MAEQKKSHFLCFNWIVLKRMKKKRCYLQQLKRLSYDQS